MTTRNSKEPSVWCLDGRMCSVQERNHQIQTFMDQPPVMTCLADICHGGQRRTSLPSVPSVPSCRPSSTTGSSLPPPYTPWSNTVVGPERPIRSDPFPKTHRRIPLHVAHVDLPLRSIESFHTFSRSDQQLKKDIQDIDKTDWDRMSRLRPRKFKWKHPPKEADKDREVYGFVAQEVQSVYPHLVRKDDKYLSVDYQQMVPLLMDRVNALQKQVKTDQLCIGDTCLTHKDLVAIKNL